jgi:hypothetical protein
LLIFYKSDSTGALDPIVICDYTRSDEQYSPIQIQTFAAKLGVLQNPGKLILPVAPYNIFSLDYSMKYSHGGMSYGDALKTKFTAVITNPPLELVGLLNIKQYGSSQNIQVISDKLVSNVIDPRIAFPTGGFVIKPNSNASNSDTINRTFMVYSVNFQYDERRTNAYLTINGAAFDSMVMRLGFSADIDKKFPLITQMKKLAASGGFILNSDPALSAVMPTVSKYYAPQPADKLINEICLDNNLMSDFDSSGKTIKIKALTPTSASLFPQYPICFNGMVPSAKIANYFSLENYYSCQTECEAFDCELFDYVTIYDDTMNGGQFVNLNKIPIPLILGPNILNGYKFYVLEYTYEDNRNKTSIKFRGTNNWVLSNLKIDNFLEAKIYGGL